VKMATEVCWCRDSPPSRQNHTGWNKHPAAYVHKTGCCAPNCKRPTM